MNIWTISLFDPTPYDKVGDHRFIQIAKSAIRNGYHVTHFTSTFRHTSKEQRFPVDTTLNEGDGYDVEYIRSQSYKKNISLKRVFAHADFAAKLIKSFDRRKKPDLVFISMPPLSSAEKVVKWGQKRGIPVVTDIIDPWPDSFIKDVPSPLKPIGKLFLRPFYRKLKFILENSAAVTSISNGYIKWAERNSSKIRRTECFYPALDLESIQKSIQAYKASETRNEDSLRIIYVGSLGSSYDLPVIVKAAEIMQNKHPKRTEFIIAGSGPQKDLVIEYENKLDNLTYLGWISDEELMRQYALSDVGLIQHKNNLTQTVTYKLFSYLSAGLPILNSLQSEMADIIESNNVGFNNDNGDVDGLIGNIELFLDDREMLKEYKKNALKLTREKGDSKAVYGKMMGLFCDIAQKGTIGSNA